MSHFFYRLPCSHSIKCLLWCVPDLILSSAVRIYFFSLLNSANIEAQLLSLLLHLFSCPWRSLLRVELWHTWWCEQSTPSASISQHEVTQLFCVLFFHRPSPPTPPRLVFPSVRRHPVFLRLQICCTQELVEGSQEVVIAAGRLVLADTHPTQCSYRRDI